MKYIVAVIVIFFIACKKDGTSDTGVSTDISHNYLHANLEYGPRGTWMFNSTGDSIKIKKEKVNFFGIDYEMIHIDAFDGWKHISLQFREVSQIGKHAFDKGYTSDLLAYCLYFEGSDVGLYYSTLDESRGSSGYYTISTLNATSIKGTFHANMGLPEYPFTITNGSFEGNFEQ